MYIEDKYKILSSSNAWYVRVNTAEAEEVKRVYNKWQEKINLYEKASKEEKFPELEKLEDNFKTSKINILGNQCLKLLKKRNETKEDYDKAYSLFIKWCVE